MLRLPNPGSTIDNFVSVYRAIYHQYNDSIATLDDLVKAVVTSNLATSSGFMGTEAIARSTRKDRSRDRLYNQLKMYAELFRTLGWLHPTDRGALHYRSTLLGSQVVAAGNSYIPLLEENLLGIAYPNRILTIRSQHNIRPFAFILEIMLHSDYGLSRDEMIVGPLSATSDQSQGAAKDMGEHIKSLRDSPDQIKSALSDVAVTDGIKTNTLQNYTRWPIATMRDCGWTEKTKFSYASSSRHFEVHRLTERGVEIARRLMASTDLRLSDVENLSNDQRYALSLYAHYSMLDRANFDITSMSSRLKDVAADYMSAMETLGADPNYPLLFSPFQSLDIEEVARIFPTINLDTAADYGTSLQQGPIEGRGSRDHLFVAPTFLNEDSSAGPRNGGGVLEELFTVYQTVQSIPHAAKTFAHNHSTDGIREFYPLVSGLFETLSLRSGYSRPGVNYQRWDGWIHVSDGFMPVEIKSPTEELFLSTKAVRQALENKIVLLARGGLATTKDLASLIVGFQLPSQRAEMANLIDDIFHSYSIRLGVVDLETLATLALKCAIEHTKIDPQRFSTLRGFLHA